MKKTLAVALAALALMGTLAVSSKDAEAHGWGRSYRVVVVHDEPVYVRRHYVRRYAVQRCRTVERFNRYGEYRGTRRVCAVIPI